MEETDAEGYCEPYLSIGGRGWWREVKDEVKDMIGAKG